MFTFHAVGVMANQVVDQARHAARARSKAERAEREADHLREKVDRLELVCAAMWSLLSEKTGATEQELMDRVEQVDLADGVADGKIGRSRRSCPQCGRTLATRHRHCLYCGNDDLRASAFDNIS